jgi:NitT/TauT family transport system substrate-binding protein
MFEPAASNYLKSNSNAYILASVGQAAGEVPYTCFSVTKDYLSKNKTKVEKFLKAVKKGYDYIMSASADDVARAVQSLFASTELSLITASVVNYKAIDAWKSDLVLEESAFNRLQDIMINAGEMRESQRVAHSTMVDNSIVKGLN